MQPFEGNCEADVVPGENEFDTPVVKYVKIHFESTLPKFWLKQVLIQLTVVKICQIVLKGLTKV